MVIIEQLFRQCYEYISKNHDVHRQDTLHVYVSCFGLCLRMGLFNLYTLVSDETLFPSSHRPWADLKGKNILQIREKMGSIAMINVATQVFALILTILTFRCICFSSFGPISLLIFILNCK